MARRSAVVFNHFPRIKQQFQDGMSQRIRKATFDILSYSQGIVAVDTGFLRSTGAAEMETPLQGVVYYTAEYSGYVEYGTRNMSAQPYLTPAAEAMRGPFHASIRHVIPGA